MAKRYPNVVKNTKGWEDLKKRIAALEGREARVGWFEGQTYGPENANLPIATVAMWQEEGTIGGQKNGSGIPSRPFIRTFFMGLRNSAAFRGFVANELKLYLAGEKTVHQVMKKLGELVQEGLRQTIANWSHPRNSDSTIAQKGFNNPLVETGLMAKSITVKIMREVKGRVR